MVPNRLCLIFFHFAQKDANSSILAPGWMRATESRSVKRNRPTEGPITRRAVFLLCFFETCEMFLVEWKYTVVDAIMSITRYDRFRQKR